MSKNWLVRNSHRGSLNKDQFDQWRDHVKHEDELINHRLTWLLVVQGFLFGAYAGLYGASAALLSSLSEHKDISTLCICDKLVKMRIDNLILAIDFAEKLLPICGAFSSLLLWWSMIAAQNVVNHIKVIVDGSTKQEKNRLALVGGSYLGEGISFLGHVSIWFIPPLLATIWLWIESRVTDYDFSKWHLDKLISSENLLVMSEFDFVLFFAVLMYLFGCFNTPFIVRNVLSKFLFSMVLVFFINYIFNVSSAISGGLITW